MIVEEKKIPKAESLNSTYNGTDKWMKSKEVIKLTIQNGGASITDEIPGGGTVKQRIADQEKQIQNNKLQLTYSAPSFVAITPSSSELSMSSQQSSEENYDAHQANGKKISKIPRRSSSVLSNNSLKSVSSGASKSTSFTKIPILKGSSLFKREALKDNTQNLYKINKAESWILISPELLSLAEAKKLIEDTASRKADALTYRNTDKVRLKNLNKNEISILEEKLPEFCKELESKEKIHIFGN